MNSSSGVGVGVGIGVDDGDTDTSHHQTSAFLVEGVGLSSAGLVGVVGNIAGLLVFSRQKRVQRNFHTLMMALATYDLAYIVVSLYVFSLPQYIADFNSSHLYASTVPVMLPLAQVGLTGSIFFTLAVTMERYFTVCHPFYKFRHSWSAWAYIVPIIVFSIGYNIPKFLELYPSVNHDAMLRVLFKDSMRNGTWTSSNTIGTADMTAFAESMAELRNKSAQENFFVEICSNESSRSYPECEYPPGQEVIYRPSPTKLRLKKWYLEIYCGWVNFIVNSLVPYVVLLSLNAAILHHLEAFSLAQTEGQLGAENMKKDVLLAKVSLVIVGVFIFCHSFRWIPTIYELYQMSGYLQRYTTDSVVKFPAWVETVSNLSHFLVVINSSSNFYIYAFKHPNILRDLSPCFQGGDLGAVGTDSAPTHLSILDETKRLTTTQLDDDHV